MDKETSDSFIKAKGVSLATGNCGLKKTGIDDTLLVELADNSSVAGVFTLSKTASAVVRKCRQILPHGKIKALVVNSGNANTFTGKQGEKTVDDIVSYAARLFSCPPQEVYTAATGVIGVAYDAALVTDILSELKQGLSENNWRKAAKSIMTTDAFPKALSSHCRIGDARINISAIAKGAGMIAPNMATMLAFIFTDANIDSPILQEILNKASFYSFNSITVDSDTSTSDTTLLCATKQGQKHPLIKTADDELLLDFKEKIETICQDLAKLIVRDGEGARKLICVDVKGAKNVKSARRIAFSIANSPLVKTAIAGADPNWGRIIMAIGKSGEEISYDDIKISICGHLIAHKGGFYRQANLKLIAQEMKKEDIKIEVWVGSKKGEAKVWGSDLNHDYIDINSKYTS